MLEDAGFRLVFNALAFSDTKETNLLDLSFLEIEVKLVDVICERSTEVAGDSDFCLGFFVDVTVGDGGH